jgi:pyruvate kinase
MNKTKLVATVGPACESDALLGAMIDAGVNVFRLNFSHGTLDKHEAVLKRIRQQAAQKKAVVAVMGDLCGPKIRIGEVAGGKCELATGQTVVFQREPIAGTPQRLSSIYPALVDDAQIGHRVLIDDGNVQLRVSEKRPNELVCTIEAGGTVSDHKGINLPDSHVSSPSLTEKDRGDLEWAIAHDLDYVALSFVRRPEDLTELREIIRGRKGRCRIVSKIEKPEAVERIKSIIDQSDVILVARGDMGVEMDVSRVPIIQKEIVLHSRLAGKPVIIATQMLQSMVSAPIPTRAEVSDVANAILDHTDAVMLSAETSVGQYPLAAVGMISRIAAQTESFDREYREVRQATNLRAHLPVATAVVRGASVVAAELNARLVAVITVAGDTARLLSRHRLACPIVAFSADERVCRQMAMLYGVIPIHLPDQGSIKATLIALERVLLERKLAALNDNIVVTADVRPDLPGETDALFIHVVGTTPS